MQTVKVDLGGLDLESKASGLRLQMSSQARFAPSAEDEIDALHERLTICELTTHSLDWPWTTRGNDFRLEILLQVEDPRCEEDQTDLVEILITQLRTAKLWKQLGLIPTSVEISNPREGAHLIAVFLAYDQAAIQTSNRHKLAEKSLPGGIQPPEGALIALLDSVCLEIHIERNRDRKRRRLQRRCSEPLKLDHSNEQSSGSPRSPDRSRDFRSFQKDANSEPEDRLTARSTSTPDLLFKSEEDDMAFDDDLMLLSSEGDDALSSPRRSPSAPSLLKRNSTASETDIENPDVDVSAVVRLVDAAIRMAISDCRRDLSKGIRLTATNSLQHLSRVAPALWSPGYLSFVSTREIFIPTISHALESVSNLVATSRKLGATARALNNIPVDASGKRRDGATSTKQFDGLLWQALRRGAYNSSSGQRLRSLAPAGKLQDAAEEHFDEILDSSRDDFEYDGSEDVLFDEDLDSQTDEFHEGVSEDDMLSVCESLDSLAMSEGDVEEFDDFQFREGNFDPPEMLCI